MGGGGGGGGGCRPLSADSTSVRGPLLTDLTSGGGGGSQLQTSLYKLKSQGGGGGGGGGHLQTSLYKLNSQVGATCRLHCTSLIHRWGPPADFTVQA